MKKGFTLVEMIAVVGILALIAIISLPTIINQLGEKRTEISEATLKIIYDAADLYLSDRQTEYPKVTGEKYCISLDDLVRVGMLQTPIMDYKTGDEIPLNMKINTTVNSYLEYSNYTLSEACN